MRSIHTERLILLGKVLENPAIAAYADAVRGDDPAGYANAYSLLLRDGMQNSLSACIENAVLRDENLFSVRSFSDGADPDVTAAFLYDLNTLQRLAESADDLPPAIREAIDEGLPKIGCGKSDALFGEIWATEKTAANLAAFYKKNGYGIFIGNKAFTFERGALVPVRNTSNISLADLKDYEQEKRAVEDNVISFLEGLPYSNMLLYGDKGTGKSSTIHAVLNKYADRGLRAVEIPKSQIGEINELKELLASLPFRFLIFIDDLSLEERDEKVTCLKASLEGSMNEKSANVMIAATSNRRHILKENFSDRENSVHARDTMEEQLSLSDRFGLTVCFSSTGKAEYLSIVRQLAADVQIPLSDEELCSLAERWAIVKGGRSPRRAKQFIDYVFACCAKKIEIDI